MRIVYKRSLAFIGLLIAISGTVGILYLFYDKVIADETIVIVDNELSINYLDGNSVVTNGEYRLSVTNNGTNDVYYSINANDIKASNNAVTYEITSKDTDIAINPTTLDISNPILINSILINPGDTQNFTIKISDNTATTFKISIEKLNDIEEYFYMTILNNNEVKKESATNVSEEVSITNEGLIESVDDDGVTYYFRGAVDNNYVYFAGITWRIVRINGDGTVKLVTNELIDTLANYNSNAEDYEVFSDTDIYETLNTFYNTNLKTYDNYIANTKYCSESSKIEDTYNAYTRIVTNKIPSFNCLGDRLTNKIGLLTADEVVYAGASYDTENKNFYLYNEEIENLWWTMTLSKNEDDDFNLFAIDEDGKLTDDVSGTLIRGVRPTINLNRQVIVTGEGTINNPYVVN